MFGSFRDEYQNGKCFRQTENKNKLASEQSDNNETMIL